MPAAKKIIWALTACYALLLLAGTLLNRLGPDQWWFGAMNLYLPQVIWLIPGTLLVLLCLVLAPRLVWAPLLCIVWALGPVMGLCWPIGTASPSKTGGGFRVMTWNVKYAQRDSLKTLELLRELDWTDPDLLLLQDAGGATYDNSPLLPKLQGWHVRSLGQYVIASKHPLSDATPMPLPIPGENEVCLRCEMRVGERKLVLYDVHLQTPRNGFNAFGVVRKVPKFLPVAIAQLQRNVQVRFVQAAALARYLANEKDPVLIAGDLNSPEPSHTCALLRDVGLHDAFSEAGKGYGYTYGHFLLKHRLPWASYSWMRLDHVMTTRQLQAVRCWTGTKGASDHRPVIADLVWRQQ